MNHTKEPWYVVQNKKWRNAKYRISNKKNDEWGSFGQIAYVSESNAKRIVACVNACEGITNEALEAGVVHSALINFEESLDLQKGEQFCFYDIPVLEDV